MARRRMEVLRSEVIASAASWRCAWNLGTENVIEPGGSITPSQRLARAFDALNAYITPIIDSPGEYVEGSPETSRNAALAFFPRSKSVRRRIIDEIWSVQFWNDGHGLTDSELERRTKESHETLSSARNWVMNAGWIRDSGLRRQNPTKRPAVIWVLTEAAIAKMKETPL